MPSVTRLDSYHHAWWYDCYKNNCDHKSYARNLLFEICWWEQVSFPWSKGIVDKFDHIWSQFAVRIMHTEKLEKAFCMRFLLTFLFWWVSPQKGLAISWWNDIRIGNPGFMFRLGLNIRIGNPGFMFRLGHFKHEMKTFPDHCHCLHFRHFIWKLQRCTDMLTEIYFDYSSFADYIIKRMWELFFHARWWWRNDVECSICSMKQV